LGRLLVVLALAMAACSSTAPTTTSTSTAGSPSVNASTSSLSALVGQWELDRTCSALVQAETEAHLTDQITYDALQELLDDSVTTSNWDPSNPCAQAKPPTEHPHTFWPEGTFNSYDENGEEVDEAPYTIQGDQVTIHNPDFGDVTLKYRAKESSLTMDPVIPENCSSDTCHETLSYAFAVSFPGETWTRVTSGPHVPPGTGSSG
jgi:hypothetical protein